MAGFFLFPRSGRHRSRILPALASLTLLALGSTALALNAVDDLVYTPVSQDGQSFVEFDVLDNDDLGDSQAVTVSQITALSPGEAGDLSQEGSLFIFFPTEGFSGLATFRYEIADSSSGLSSSATVTIQVGVAANPGFTAEQRNAVGVILDACAGATGTLAQTCQSIEQLSPGEQLSAIRQIQPNQVSAQANSARLQQARQDNNLRGRLQNLRSGSARGLSLAGLSLHSDQGSLPLGRALDAARTQRGQASDDGMLFTTPTAADHAHFASPGMLSLAEVMPLRYQGMDETGDNPTGQGRQTPAAFADTPWGLFLTGRINRGDIRRRGGQPGLDFDTLSLTAGLDYRLDARLVAGAAVGFSRTENDFSGNQGRMDADSWTLSVYGSYAPDEHAWIDWMAGYSRNDYQGRRRLQFGEIDSIARYSTDGHQYHLSLGGGYDWHRGAWQYGPYARVNYLHTLIDSYRERGGAGLALHIGNQQERLFETALGGRLSRAVSIPQGVLIPGLDIEWVRDWSDGHRRINAGLVEAPGSGRFAVTTRSISPRHVNIGVSLTGVFAQGRSAFIRYQTVSNSRDVDEYSIEAGLRLEF